MSGNLLRPSVLGRCSWRRPVLLATHGISSSDHPTTGPGTTGPRTAPPAGRHSLGPFLHGRPHLLLAIFDLRSVEKAGDSKKVSLASQPVSFSGFYGGRRTRTRTLWDPQSSLSPLSPHDGWHCGCGCWALPWPAPTWWWRAMRWPPTKQCPAPQRSRYHRATSRTRDEMWKVCPDRPPAQAGPPCLFESLPLLASLLNLNDVHSALPHPATSLPTSIISTTTLFPSSSTAISPPPRGAHRRHHAPLLPHRGHHLEALGVDVHHPVPGQEGRPGIRFTTPQVEHISELLDRFQTQHTFPLLQNTAYWDICKNSWNIFHKMSNYFSDYMFKIFLAHIHQILGYQWSSYYHLRGMDNSNRNYFPGHKVVLCFRIALGNSIVHQIKFQ